MLAVITGSMAGTLALASPALGATVTWTGIDPGCVGQWSDAICWSPAVAPADGDDVVLAQGGGSPATYDINRSFNSLTLNTPNSGSYTVNNPGGFTLGLQSGGFITDNNSTGPDTLNTGVTLNGPATFTVSAGADGLTFGTNPVTGAGPLALVNNSTDDALVLNVANTYAGATTIGGSGRVLANVDGAIPTASALTVDGSIRFATGSTIGSLAGSGDVFIPPGDVLAVGGDNTSTTFSGVIQASAGNLEKHGAGTLTLSGANANTGATSVHAGTLSVTGSLAFAAVVWGGALKGTGTINGGVVVNPSGALAPGVSVGTLNVGNGLGDGLLHFPGSTLAAEIDGTGSDRVDVNGTVDLDDATLTLALLAGYVHAPGTVYTLVENNLADPVDGTYLGLAEGATITEDGHVFRVSYAGGDGNDVTLTAIGASPTLSTTASANVTLGGSVHDTATLAGGNSPGGTITFRLFGPGDASCSAAPAFTSTPVAVSGNGSYDSPSFTPTAAGTYHWTASYSGDDDNNPASTACGDTGESVDVVASPDTTPPETTITKKPTKRHPNRSIFRFESSEPGSAFECSLDDRRFKPCSSPVVYRHLDRGRHDFAVFAIDAAGNRDPTPATARFRVRGRKRGPKHRGGS